MSNFNELRKVKLSEYKKVVLKIVDDGKWRKQEYSHILPKQFQEFNILYGIRDSFWTYQVQMRFKLHPGFSHLNSSQAMFFNLFYPLMSNGTTLLSKFIESIVKEEKYPVNISNLNIKSCEFEKILDSKEETNFDFYVELDNGYRVVLRSNILRMDLVVPRMKP